ncbi:hypothetical protein [Deinococcus ficus]|uniref:DUF1269 domain-containing protein n=1 Tax=Deinococcus ficus TaxID=317577 RepID=A0A221T2N6_9DEIO|nr:hypothetical protein [Deinococcus ficus]ASN83187.1 hypothetical protein DFI_18475 [Deinococcus ficus]
MKLAVFPSVGQLQRFLQDLECRGVNVDDVSVLHSARSGDGSAEGAAADAAVFRVRAGGEHGLMTGAGIGALTGLGLGALLVTAGPFALAPLLGMAAIGAGTDAVSGLVAGMVGGAGSAVVDRIGQKAGRSGANDVQLDEPVCAVARQAIETGGGVVALRSDTLSGDDLQRAASAHGGHVL